MSCHVKPIPGCRALSLALQITGTWFRIVEGFPHNEVVTGSPHSQVRACEGAIFKANEVGALCKGAPLIPLRGEHLHSVARRVAILGRFKLEGVLSCDQTR